MHHPRGYGTFARVINQYVNRKKLLSLEDAVHKMTGMTARIVGIRDRGKIAAGFKADIIIFDPGEVKDPATYDEPHQLAKGFEIVLVNGKVAVSDGQIRDQRYGNVLRKK
jgi:N-acyl-D-aspartate/D-glutamate deacylase